MTYNWIDISKYIVNIFNINWSPISHLKLQKILYYTEWRSLAILNNSIVNFEFEARINWPVCRNIYNEFKIYWFDDLPNFELDKKLNLEENDISLINEVISKYWKLSARDLVNLSHSEEPRIKARSWLINTDIWTAIIQKEIMKNYFKMQIS